MRVTEGAGKRSTLLAFGTLLKRLRLVADLTQEELAERAAISARLISDLERGTVHRPRRDTVRLLADGLRLSGSDRDAFVALARGELHIAPSLPTDEPPRYRLPHPPTPIVARLKETAAVTALLLDPEVRLLTLTGPGGVGKTRLALEVAARVCEVVDDGVVFVDLAPLRDSELVDSAIAEALGLLASPDLPSRDRVVQALQEKQVVLLLDNCEHLATVAAVAAELLAACPRLTVFATSRMPLHIRAEREYPVDPLALPDQEAVTSLAELAQIPAVDLFVRRAEAANRAFALTSGNAPAIAEIAIRLDGLPLAIELAATRIKMLSPATLVARLEPRMPILTGGACDLPARQQTLRATLDWSHDLLSATEQVLFRRLAVFAGGCTLEAAESVAGVEYDLITPPASVLDLLGGLIDKSLLRVLDALGDQQRFGMLETIREYGRERLASSGEEENVRDRHLAWCLDLAGRAAMESEGADQIVWVRRLDADLDNLRAAMGWALERRLGELAQRLGGALCDFWIVRGHFDEGRRWLKQALLLETDAPPIIRATALVGMARIAHLQGDYELASALEEALELFRAAGDSGGEARVLAALSKMFAGHGDYARASVLAEEALAIFRLRGDQPNVARLLNSRGLSAYDVGDYDQATSLFEEALSLGRSLGSWQSVAYVLNNLALVAHERRDDVQAETLQAEALDLMRSLGDVDGMASCLENFAIFAQAQNELERSMRLFGAADALRVRIGAPGRPNDRELNERYIAEARVQLGDDAFVAAYGEGEAMSLEVAIAHALE